MHGLGDIINIYIFPMSNYSENFKFIISKDCEISQREVLRKSPVIHSPNNFATCFSLLLFKIQIHLNSFWLLFFIVFSFIFSWLAYNLSIQFKMLWLTHFRPIFFFCTIWKYQKNLWLLMFPRGIEWNNDEQWITKNQTLVKVSTSQ